MSKLTIGLVQQSCTESKQDNIRRTMDSIREAAKRGARLVCLQELHAGPYFCQYEGDVFFDLAETIPGPTTEAFGKLAKELGVVLVLSLFEKRAAGLYHNTAVVIESDGSIAGTYRKTHIPDDPGYYEKFFFTPGDLGIRPIKTSVGTLGVLVCWDQWYPEAARLMALSGADLLIYPTAIGTKPEDPKDEHERQIDAWITIQRSHAIANCVPVAVINRVGFEKDPSGVRQGLHFWGKSFITGCQGEFLARAATDKDETVIATIDTELVDRTRRAWPFFRDRRVDLYADLVKRFRD